MKLRRHKVQFPRDGEEPALQQWLAEYERESRNFSVCKFFEQVGAGHPLGPVIRLHDDLTGVMYPQQLA